MVFQKSNRVEKKLRVSVMTEMFHRFMFSVLFWDTEALVCGSEQLYYGFKYRCS